MIRTLRITCENGWNHNNRESICVCPNLIEREPPPVISLWPLTFVVLVSTGTKCASQLFYVLFDLYINSPLNQRPVGRVIVYMNRALIRSV